jgi:hypothetical protein
VAGDMGRHDSTAAEPADKNPVGQLGRRKVGQRFSLDVGVIQGDGAAG